MRKRVENNTHRIFTGFDSGSEPELAETGTEKSRLQEDLRRHGEREAGRSSGPDNGS